MEGAIIREVIARYGFYSAEKEREFVKSRQRTPEAAPASPDGADAKPIVVRFMSRHPGWWTLTQVGQLLGLREQTIWYPMTALVHAGHVEKERQARGCRTKPQRYRWISIEGVRS